jgi:hypothetical protein
LARRGKKNFIAKNDRFSTVRSEEIANMLLNKCFRRDRNSRSDEDSGCSSYPITTFKHENSCKRGKNEQISFFATLLSRFKLELLKAFSAFSIILNSLLLHVCVQTKNDRESKKENEKRTSKTKMKKLHHQFT